MESDSSNIASLIVLLIFVLPIVLSLYYRHKYKKEAVKLERSIVEVANLENSKGELLKKLEPILDAEEEARKIINEAEKHLEQSVKKLSEAKNKADLTIAESNNEAERRVDKANQQAERIVESSLTVKKNTEAEIKVLKQKASNILSDANTEAEVIVSEGRNEAERSIEYANNRAEEIAGSALEAKDKADSYAAAIKAMKNTIEGYKDDYIIPNHSVLDDLAEEYGHKEAGAQLKLLRQRVKNMVKENRAADCDYAEANRRAYAIHFAVDAFNGKVDSSLAKVKRDNFGKIKQEIIDAYALVNHNGAPFRNARILQEYLDTRLEELKWAVATHELRQLELAEQKAIRDQIREEEKARKEMEKAIKEAEKEERLLQKALEKARKELSAASDEQKQQFETQLAELEAKLHDAEEKGQRAISMAQQTKRGHVYVISNIGSFGEEVFKVGMTRRLEPMDRVKELGDASVPFSFDVHAMIYSDDAPALEKSLHKAFHEKSVNKINPRKEFFRLPLSEIKQKVINEGVEDIHWTMKAEAAEYRESVAMLESSSETNLEKELVY